MGYLDTMKIFDKLHGLSYYLTDIPREDKIVNFLNNFGSRTSAKTMMPIYNILKITKAPSIRSLFEYVIPTIARLFDCPKNMSYTDIFISIIEFMAEYYGIERLKQYKFTQLLHEVLIQLDSHQISTEPKSLRSIESIKERLGIGVPKYDLARLLLTAYASYV
jgi:hypothetical protein